MRKSRAEKPVILDRLRLAQPPPPYGPYPSQADQPPGNEEIKPTKKVAFEDSFCEFP